MICPKCGKSRVSELAESWSAWGLHELGLDVPQIKITVSCMSCGFSVSVRSQRVSDPDIDKSIKETVRRAKKRFSDGENSKQSYQISWEKAAELIPEIKDHYQKILSLHQQG
jgi:transcription elongation factor Elf1